MGLAERRSQKAFADQVYPILKQEIFDIIGKEIEFDIKWETIALVDGWSHLFEEAWTKQYFKTLAAALRSIARDDLGKEALEEGLTKVVIQNTTGNSNPAKMARFEGTSLILDHKPFTNIPNPDASDGKGDFRFRDRVAAIIAVLEANL